LGFTPFLPTSRPDWSRSCFEVYANEPGTVPEDELVTEMYQPIS
jgi:DNA gyrase inhibitor GyrI